MIADDGSAQRSRRAGSVRRRGALTIIPVAIVLLPLLLRGFVGPYYAAPNFDPAYAYLFNALNVLRGEVPGHFDHPGTPLQIIGAGVVGVTWLISSTFAATELPLVDAVLSDPERYLRSINFVLSVAIAAALFAFSCRLQDLLGGTAFSVLAQLVLLASPSVLTALHEVTPETVLIVAILVLATVVGPAAVERQEQQNGRRAVLTGGILGFAIATKVTAIPWLLLIFLFRGWRRQTLAAAAAALAFLICTLPIWPRFPQMFDWFVNLAMHSGRYGSGEVGLPGFAAMAGAAARLLRSELVLPITLIVSVAALLVLLWRTGRSNVLPEPSRLLLVGVVAVLFSILMTSKHPEARYLLPATVASALLLPLAVHALQTIPITRASILVAVLACVFLAKTVSFTAHWLDNLLYQQQQFARVSARADALNCRRAFYFRSTSLTFPLFAGNYLADWRYSADLSRLYPDSIHFRILDNYLYDFEGRLSDDEVRELLSGAQPLCLIGTKQLPPNLANLAVKPDATLSSEDQTPWRSWWGTLRRPGGPVQNLYISQSPSQ